MTRVPLRGPQRNGNRMAFKTGGGDELNSEINVTPMVDVMLVLLIIFMITAPMMNTGVSLELPQVTAQNLEDPEGKLVLSIAKDDKIFLGGTQVSWKGLEDKLKTNERVRRESALYIEADNALLYGRVVTAMAIAKNAGVTRVMMLTAPTDTLNLDMLDQNAAGVPPSLTGK
jgi:biopolymer transport protein TolR